MSIIYGTDVIFTSRSSNTIITLKPGAGEELRVEGSLSSAGLSLNRALSGYYTLAQAATTLTLNTWSKVLGTSTQDAHNYNFTITDNKAVYTGSITGIFLISYTVTLYGTNNDIISVGVSKGGSTPDQSSVTTITMLAASATSTFNNTCHVSLSKNDYVEIFVFNASGSNSITASRLSVNILGIF